MKFQFALIGVVQGIADIARQVDIRRRQQNAFQRILDGHDARQRIVRFHLFLMVTYQPHQLVAMAREKIAADFDETGRKAITNAVTRRTHDLYGPRRLITPLPATGMVDGAALRTHHRLVQLSLEFIAVVNAFLSQLIAADRNKTGIR